MAVPPCPDNCESGVPYLDWITYSQLYQEYLTYCALATAAGNYPGPGPFQPLGVYTNTTDATYVVPADASLIFWEVPGQTGDQFIDFSLVQEGQEVTIVVIDSNGFNVTDSDVLVFSLNDTSHRIQGVKSTGAGGVTRITGTAAQYDIGTSGATVPLLNGNWVKTGTTEFQGNVEIDGTNRLYLGSTSGGYFVNNSNIGFSFFVPGGDDNFAVFAETGNIVFDFGGSAGATIFRSQLPGGLFIRTVGDTAITVQPNQATVAEFTDNGTLVATSGTGGARVAKWLQGKATLVAGTVTVTDAAATSNSIITCSPEGTGAGHLNYTISAGVSFTINSSDGADTRTVSYQRIVPA